MEKDGDGDGRTTDDDDNNNNRECGGDATGGEGVVIDARTQRKRRERGERVEKLYLNWPPSIQLTRTAKADKNNDDDDGNGGTKREREIASSEQ